MPRSVTSERKNGRPPSASPGTWTIGIIQPCSIASSAAPARAGERDGVALVRRRRAVGAHRHAQVLGAQVVAPVEAAGGEHDGVARDLVRVPPAVAGARELGAGHPVRAGAQRGDARARDERDARGAARLQQRGDEGAAARHDARRVALGEEVRVVAVHEAPALPLGVGHRRGRRPAQNLVVDVAGRERGGVERAPAERRAGQRAGGSRGSAGRGRSGAACRARSTRRRPARRRRTPRRGRRARSGRRRAGRPRPPPASRRCRPRRRGRCRAARRGRPRARSSRRTPRPARRRSTRAPPSAAASAAASPAAPEPATTTSTAAGAAAPITLPRPAAQPWALSAARSSARRGPGSSSSTSS